MDIGDCHQTFGLLVPKLAQDHPTILDALLQLSALSLGSQVASRPDLPSMRGSVIWQLNTIKQTEGLPYMLPMICWVLNKTQNFVESVPETWEPFFSDDRTSLVGSSFESTELRVGWLATAGLMSRLGMFLCLIAMTYQPISTNRSYNLYWRIVLSKLSPTVHHADTDENRYSACFGLRNSTCSSFKSPSRGYSHLRTTRPGLRQFVQHSQDTSSWYSNFERRHSIMLFTIHRKLR